MADFRTFRQGLAKICMAWGDGKEWWKKMELPRAIAVCLSMGLYWRSEVEREKYWRLVKKLNVGKVVCWSSARFVVMIVCLCWGNWENIVEIILWALIYCDDFNISWHCERFFNEKKTQVYQILENKPHFKPNGPIQIGIKCQNVSWKQKVLSQLLHTWQNNGMSYYTTPYIPARTNVRLGVWILMIDGCSFPFIYISERKGYESLFLWWQLFIRLRHEENNAFTKYKDKVIFVSKCGMLPWFTQQNEAFKKIKFI